MANENSIDVYHALMALEEKVTGTAPDPENVTTDVALALADIFRTDVPMAQETAIVNAIDTITANYGGGGGADVGALVAVLVNFDEPTVGVGGIGGADGPHTVAIGDTVIGNGDIPGIGEGSLYGSFAAGMTAQTMSYETVDTLSAYACTIGDDGVTGAVYQTVEPYALEATRTSGEGGYSWTFVIPEMEEGVALVLYPHTAD